MAFVALIPRAAYEVGTTTHGPVRLPAKVKRCRFRISRFGKNPDGTVKAGSRMPAGAAVCRVVVQHRPKGASAWQHWTTYTLDGGVRMVRESGVAVHQGASPGPYEQHEGASESEVGPGDVRARLTTRVPLRLGMRMEVA